MKSTRSLLSAKVLGIKVATEFLEEQQAAAPTSVTRLDDAHRKAVLSWVLVTPMGAATVLKAIPDGWYIPDYAKPGTLYGNRALTLKNDSVYVDIELEILMDKKDNEDTAELMKLAGV